MYSRVAAGTSPTTTTFDPSTTVDSVEEAPKLADEASMPFDRIVVERDSTNTDTDARPSVKTTCETGAFEPGMSCADWLAIRKPGGKRRALSITGCEISGR